MPPQTPKIVILTVVITLSIVSIVGIGALAGTMFFKNYADPVVLNSFTNMTTFALGAVAGILGNTRQQKEPETPQPNPPS